MKNTHVLLALLAVFALMAAGCGDENPRDLSSTAPDAQFLTAKNGSGPYFYTIHWSIENNWETALQIIDLGTGLGTSEFIFTGSGLEPTYPGAFLTPYGVAFDLDGTLYTIVNWFDGVQEHSEAQLGTVDLETGEITTIGPRHPINLAGPEVDAKGNIYATGFTVGDPEVGQIPPIVWGDSYLYRFDKWTGELIQIGDTGHTEWMDMAMDSEGRLWATFANDLYVLDTETGASTFMMHVDGVPQSDVPGVCEADWPWMEIMSIDFDRHGVMWATAMRGFSFCDQVDAPVMSIDLETGQATVVGYTHQGYNHGGDIPPERVTVCHKRGRGDYVEITVAMGALDAHLAHGDMVPGVDFEGCGCPDETDVTPHAD